MHYSKRQPGFTLAEFLIALTILGVIATFSIPKILAAQADQKRFAVFKETISALGAAFYQDWSQGIVTEGNSGSLLISHLNAVKICDTNALTQGCWPPGTDPVPGQKNTPGVILANGAMIAGLDDTDSGVGYDFIVID